jgi:CheY-like chemotaxis protein
MEEPQKKKHVLFADDDPATRRLFGAKLASAGFEVLYAKDGNEELEMATRFVPDLVITDVDMPYTDGIKASFRLRGDPRTKDIPIIFLTNADLSADAEKAIKELGKAEYIPKAIDLAEFVTQVKAIIE